MDVKRWRAEIRARLAAARSDLLSALLGLDEAILTALPLVGQRTLQDLAQRAAVSDAALAASIHRIRGGYVASPPDRTSTSPPAWPLSQTIHAMQEERRALLDALAALPDEAVFVISRTATDGGTVAEWLEECLQRDLTIVMSLRTSRAPMHARSTARPGPIFILVAALRAARKELLTEIALIPAADRSRAVLRQDRTLEASLSQLADRAQTVTAALTDRQHVQPATASWSGAWRQLHDSHRALVVALEAVDDDRLPPSPGTGDLYSAICDLVHQDRACAAALRQARRAPVGDEDYRPRS